MTPTLVCIMQSPAPCQVWNWGEVQYQINGTSVLHSTGRVGQYLTHFERLKLMHALDRCNTIGSAQMRQAVGKTLLKEDCSHA